MYHNGKVRIQEKNKPLQTMRSLTTTDSVVSPQFSGVKRRHGSGELPKHLSTSNIWISKPIFALVTTSCATI